jgi:hypothetical protein
MVCFLHGAFLSTQAQENLRKGRKEFTRRFLLASFRQDVDTRSGDGIPSLEDMESGKLVGAVLPMSDKAQTQMRESIEVIDYLLNQERVVWM